MFMNVLNQSRNEGEIYYWERDVLQIIQLCSDSNMSRNFTTFEYTLKNLCHR